MRPHPWHLPPGRTRQFPNVPQGRARSDGAKASCRCRQEAWGAMGSPMTRCSNPRGAVRASRPPDRELHGGECLGDVKFTSSAFNLPRMREGRAGKRAQELLREADGRRRAQRMSAFPESSETDCMCTMSTKCVLWAHSAAVPHPARLQVTDCGFHIKKIHLTICMHPTHYRIEM